MIFVNTRVAARRLVEHLQRHGYTARGLTGNVDQSRRLRVLDDFRDGRLPILVATDVASRGLHIEGVSHVINYDLPQDPEDYVHRIGRTARVGAEGKAITLACEDYVYSLDAVHKLLGYEIPIAPLTEDLLAEVKPRGRQRGPSDRRPRRSSNREDTSGAAERPKRRRRRGRGRSRKPAADTSKPPKPE
jgi:ATP-dependent RNA helicase RhlB